MMKICLAALIVCIFGWLGLAQASQPSAPYLTFDGNVLPNNSYVRLRYLREAEPFGISCHTDLPTCCSGRDGPHRGDWYFPSGERLPFPPRRSLIEMRGSQRVLLREYRYINPGYYEDGIYQCAVDTVASHGDSGHESVYVGVYENRGHLRMSISFEMMTEPDTDAPKFPYTVTCTSTGGPATRSNFTKNGAQLGELELVDRVSAAYRRVAVGSGGEGVGDCYHCSASNDRPSAASDTLCLVGARPPTNVTVKVIPHTTFNVSWTPPTEGLPVTGYVIFFDNGVEKKAEKADNGKTEQTIDTGICGNYTITMVATSEYLPSIETPPVYKELLVPTPSIKAVTPGITSASVVLFADLPLEKYSYRCRLQQLTGCESGGNTCEVHYTECGRPGNPSNYNIINISDLQPNTKYSLIVTLAHENCRASDSTPMNFTTLPAAAPGPVTCLTKQFQNYTMVNVSWEEPCETNGIILGYEVTYWLEGGPQDNAERKATEKSWLAFEIPPTPVANSPMVVSVRAITKDGGEGPSKNISFCVTRLAPPTSFSASVLNATAVNVTWSSADPVPAGLYGVTYELHYQSTAQDRVVEKLSRELAVDSSSPTSFSLVMQVDDSLPDLEHQFKLTQRVDGRDNGDPMSVSAEFDKSYFQVQFGPLENCLSWGIEKAQRIESTLQTAIVAAVYQFCSSTHQKQLLFSWLRPGAFSCRSDPMVVTYRSTIVSPSVPDLSTTARELVDYVASWIQTNPLLVVDHLWVSVNKNCSTHLTSLTDPECDVAMFSSSF